METLKSVHESWMLDQDFIARRTLQERGAITDPFYTFKDAGCRVCRLWLSKAGRCPSTLVASLLPVSTRKRFEESDDIAAPENTQALDQVKIQVMIEDIDCILLAGSHGIFVAFEEGCADIVTRSYAAGRAVAAVCHGSTGFVGAKDGAGPLVRRQKVAGFSNDEEKTVGLYGKVPNVLETMFEELGAKYVEGETFKRYAVRDERLVTGQNSMSSVTCAGSVLETLEWFLEAGFSVHLYQACKGTFFCGGMLFRRTLAPTMKRYVDEALVRFREEERFSRCMFEVLGAAGLSDETYKKKANNHTATAFEEAHMNSSDGTMVAASPEVAMLQEFIKGWMTEFVSCSWDVLENGVNEVPKAQIREGWSGRHKRVL